MGEFAGLPEGGFVSFNGQLRVSYAAGDGNDVALIDDETPFADGFESLSLQPAKAVETQNAAIAIEVIRLGVSAEFVARLCMRCIGLPSCAFSSVVFRLRLAASGRRRPAARCSLHGKYSTKNI